MLRDIAQELYGDSVERRRATFEFRQRQLQSRANVRVQGIDRTTGLALNSGFASIRVSNGKFGKNDIATRTNSVLIVRNATKV